MLEPVEQPTQTSGDDLEEIIVVGAFFGAGDKKGDNYRTDIEGVRRVGKGAQAPLTPGVEEGEDGREQQEAKSGLSEHRTPDEGKLCAAELVGGEEAEDGVPVALSPDASRVHTEETVDEEAKGTEGQPCFFVAQEIEKADAGREEVRLLGEEGEKAEEDELEELDGVSRGFFEEDDGADGEQDTEKLMAQIKGVAGGLVDQEEPGEGEEEGEPEAPGALCAADEGEGDEEHEQYDQRHDAAGEK